MVYLRLIRILKYFIPSLKVLPENNAKEELHIRQ